MFVEGGGDERSCDKLEFIAGQSRTNGFFFAFIITSVSYWLIEGSNKFQDVILFIVQSRYRRFPRTSSFP